MKKRIPAIVICLMLGFIMSVILNSADGNSMVRVAHLLQIPLWVLLGTMWVIWFFVSWINLFPKPEDWSERFRINFLKRLAMSMMVGIGIFIFVGHVLKNPLVFSVWLGYLFGPLLVFSGGFALKTSQNKKDAA